MTATTKITAQQYRLAAERARILRAAVAQYAQPMDEALAAWVVETQGEMALAALVRESAAYLAECQAELATVNEVVDAFQAGACSRCSGTGFYSGPTSHRNRKGQPVCFQCNGSGQRG